MQHFPNRERWIEAILAWSKSKHNENINAAVSENLDTQTEGFEQGRTPVIGYIPAVSAIFRWGDRTIRSYTPADLNSKIPEEAIVPFKDAAHLIKDIYPRAARLSREFEYEEYAPGHSAYPHGVFSKYGEAYVSNPSIVGIGCGHYRMRKEKVFTGVLGFTDIMPQERMIAEWAAAPYVPTICGHTQGCGKKLSVCDCCGVLICDECLEGSNNPNRETTTSSMVDLHIDGNVQSYCPLWGPTDLKNWEDYVHRPIGESMDSQPDNMVYGHPGTDFFTHLDLIGDANEHSFRTLNYVYPPVRARCDGHPLYNQLWSTTHPTTVPNRGPGEIYTIHDEDCCNDRGKVTHHKLIGKKSFIHAP